MSTHLSLQAVNMLDYLSLERTINAAQATSKKKVIENIAKTLSANVIELKEHDLFEQLLQREQLGSTAIGHGCAIPHCRAEGIDHVYACFLKLSQPIDFDAPDKEAVDLVLAIVVPSEANDTHLNILAHVAEILHKPEIRAKLRQAKSSEELYQLLIAF